MRSFVRSVGRRFSSSLLSLLVAGFAVDAVAQSVRQEDPIPDSTRQSLTAIEHSFVLGSVSPPNALFPRMREEMTGAPAFLRDSKASFGFRSYYRDVVTNKAPGSASWSEAWAAGGAATWQSGRLFDLISGGMVLYTSFPVYAALDRDGTGLLLPGQQQYGVLGQLYGKVHITDDHEFVAGRYLYDTPFVGSDDNRMSPKTFYGYAVKGIFGNPQTGPAFRYGGGYLAAMKERNSTEFISMSRSAGADQDRGAGVAGGLFTWGPLSIGAIEYYSQDTINIAYAEGKYGIALAPKTHAVLALQFADQHSTGANLLNNGVPFGTSQFAAQLQLGFESAILTAAYSVVNPGFGMQTPWSANPFYTDSQNLSFNRAGENAALIGLSLGFKPFGLPGVAASIFYVGGWTDAPAAGAPVREREWDFIVDWRPKWKPLQGIWLSMRYGFSVTDQGGQRTTTDDVRLILNYSVKLY